MTAEFKIFVATWNVAERLPPNDLTALLDLDENVSGNDLADIYAIGLQELKSDTTSLLSDSIFDDPWTTTITNLLAAWDYVRIKSLRLVGIHLAVYVRRKHLLNLSNVESEYTRTGLGGLWGNKGGVSVRFEVNGVNICFVNSHLSAHMENFAQRIEDYNQIVMTQKFRDPNTPTILDHDYIFWMGDLNFRLDDVSNDETRKKIGANNLTYLLQHDQLNQAKLKELILIDFDEGDISFPPTYKFNPESDLYDTSAKNRIPAWCDRILWRVHEDSFEGTTLKTRQLRYKSLPQYKISDHKPVVAAFTIKVLDSVAVPPVMFEPLSSWSKNRDQKVFFSVIRGFPSSGRDWIGLYPSHFKHFEDYQAYSWLGPRSANTFDDTSFLYSVPFEERFLDKLALGRYIMVYFSATRNCVVSYSNVFKLIDGDESSSEDEGSDDRKRKLMKLNKQRPQTRASFERRSEMAVNKIPYGSEVEEKFEEAVMARKENVFEAGNVSKEVEGVRKRGVGGMVDGGAGGGNKDGGGKVEESGAFEDAYMNLRDEGYKEKQKELDDRMATSKGHKQTNKHVVNLEISEELDEASKRLRLQAVDQLLLSTHLDNIAGDLDDLMGGLDCGKEEKDDGVIKARSEFKLLIDDRVNVDSGKVCDVISSDVTSSENSKMTSTSGCSRTVNYLDDLNCGLVVGTEVERDVDVMDEVRRAYDEYESEPTRWVRDGGAVIKKSSSHHDHHHDHSSTTVGPMKKDLSLNDFEIVEKQEDSFEDICMASKNVMREVDNKNNNKSNPGGGNGGYGGGGGDVMVKQTFTSNRAAPGFKQPSTEAHQHANVVASGAAQSPFEEAYMELRRKAMEEKGSKKEVVRQEELDGRTERNVEEMLINQHLEDFSECLDLNPSGRLKKREMDEERWREEKRGGNIRVTKHHDLLIKELRGAGDDCDVQVGGDDVGDFEAKMDPCIDNVEIFQNKSSDNKIISTNN